MSEEPQQPGNQPASNAAGTRSMSFLPIGIGLGLIIGVVLGLLIFDNVGLGIGIGLAIGAGLGVAVSLGASDRFLGDRSDQP